MNTRGWSGLAISLLLLATGCQESGVIGGSVTLGGGAGTIIYRADRSIDTVEEVFAVSSGSRLNEALVLPQTVQGFALTPDASAVVYIADQDKPG